MLTVSSSGRENEYLLHWTKILSLAWLAALAESCVVHNFMDEIPYRVLGQEKAEHQRMHYICVLGTVS